jgi:outer membrane immunogenic protein
VPTGSATTVVTNAFSATTPWFGTVRGRLGTTVFNPMLLAYVTGGLAYGRENVSNFMSVTNGGALVETFPFSTGSTKTGYTIGGGLEWMFAHNWSVRAEYLYVSLPANGSQVVATTFLGPLAFATDAMQLNPGRDNINVVRLGLDYKFDWGPAARY